jgi:hypothetical protein
MKFCFFNDFILSVSLHLFLNKLFGRNFSLWPLLPALPPQLRHPTHIPVATPHRHPEHNPKDHPNTYKAQYLQILRPINKHARHGNLHHQTRMQQSPHKLLQHTAPTIHPTRELLPRF